MEVPDQETCSIQALNILDNAHSPWGGQASLFSLLFQMLLFQKRPGMTQNNVLPTMGIL